MKFGRVLEVLGRVIGGKNINTNNGLAWNKPPIDNTALRRGDSSEITRQWRKQTQALVDDRRQIPEVLYTCPINFTHTFEFASDLGREFQEGAGVAEQIVYHARHDSRHCF